MAVQEMSESLLFVLASNGGSWVLLSSILDTVDMWIYPVSVGVERSNGALVGGGENGLLTLYL